MENKEKVENPSAFPEHSVKFIGQEKITSYQPGMNLRDYFAAKALNGALANTKIKEDVSNAAIAENCYAIAEAMLKERMKYED